MEAYQHFGLSTPPFDGAPDPRFFFHATSHAEALATLEYAIHAGKPCTLAIGESGSGKTLLGRVLAQRGVGAASLLWIHGIGQSGDRTDVAIFPPADLRRSNPLKPRQVVDSTLGEWIRTRLAKSAPAVIVVDNADALREHNWQDILALLTREAHAMQPISLVLFGLPDLLSVLSDPELVRLQRRVFRTCSLARLTGPDVSAYIRHRWTVAGGGEAKVFTSAALGLIHRFSDGNPALVNQLCDNAMLDAFSEERARIDARDVIATLQAITGRTEQRRCLPGAVPLGPALTLSQVVGDDEPAPTRVKEVVADVTTTPLGDRLRTIETRLSETLSRVAAARTRSGAPASRLAAEVDSSTL
jgi:general secretion pathway protein A